MGGNGRTHVSSVSLFLVLVATVALSEIAEHVAGSQTSDSSAEVAGHEKTGETDAEEREEMDAKLPGPVEVPPLYGSFKFLNSWLLSLFLVSFPPTRLLFLGTRPLAYENDLNDRESARDEEYVNEKFLEWHSSHKRARARREGLQKLIADANKAAERSTSSTSRGGIRGDQAHRGLSARVNDG
ncbi:hypothetical protein TGPRC2_216720 [Toxoplasma gondii TgCatPRC2]|uniref:Transmembrane protein n=8 Tax=Toxoplasma gondii TaxID=5811 RepID=B6KSS5_TOXGV|nr:hypothetical protein TGME49_216720 [Toxoplasma gondii ME49]ESS28679.1 hypothetical protein TGVEG_216720 [Toxoplasma gondii VEG]KFG32462.1 hypothetical protein TGDOM2_216720 [Toxoplasma gondii GAB2-2007-GAL-DOM2]KFG41149.1 hypothetical protein TGFOU_216720 [Toxoplasma gondii FOU]KYF38783.1 hypothetical protein TGARI_216720 [Toxoplasma gondii ARI]KYK64428.1 hypothetical protein TGPRC2_216720 [Toxoplasma gondii TgCatPRC2]PIL96660.1 hypothetical protein TGCOUG_216720 [Toxoplasma gondii COUG]P|eukprot:XP_002370980.1 hypothetical protein TGME49_216720 [Toxoplasma gondii ME49]